MATKKRIIGLDVVRAVAVLLVLFCHVSQVTLDVGGPFLIYAQRLSAVYGVELFFVLSGFLIGEILLRQFQHGDFERTSLRSFWTRRWFRTLPNYYLFLLVLGLYTRYKNGSMHLLTHLFFLQNLWVYRPGDFYGVSWSLCVEEWMYLLLPLVLLGWQRLLGRASERAALLTAATFLAVPLLLRFCFASGLAFDDGIRKVVAFRLDAIGVGVLLAYLRVFRPTLFRALSGRAGLITGILLAGLMAWALRPWLENVTFAFESRLTNSLLLPGIDVSLGLLIAFGATVPTLGARTDRIWLGISVVSYSLYLFHSLVFFVVQEQVGRLGLPPAGYRTVVVVLTVSVAFAIAAFVYRFYEHPLTNLRERFKPKQPSPDRVEV